MRRRIIGNLLYEVENSGPPSPKPLGALLATIGTLLRVFATGDDELWLPAAIARARVPRVAGLARPKFVSGEARRRPDVPELAWAAIGETRPIAAIDASSRLAELAWQLPPADPERARKLNDSATLVAIADAVELTMPGRAIIDDPEALSEHIAKHFARDARRWVLKPCCGAAGQYRAFGDGLEAAALTRAKRFVARHRRVIVEPWHDRTQDYGCCGWLTRDAHGIVGRHRNRVDANGRFLGVDVAVAGGGALGLSPEGDRELCDTFEAVCLHARRLGYVGPIGIDAWTHRTGDGERFHALGEINARFTIGWLTAAIVQAMRGAGALEAGAARLEISNRAVKREAHDGARNAIVLVEPDDRGIGITISNS